ncbi:MAG: SseB family protein [Brotaphodocola sp.]
MSENTAAMPLPKKELLKRLANAEGEFYVVMSLCTKLPYIVCDEETYDDEILLYFNEEEVKAEFERLNGLHIPVNVTKLNTKQMMFFFTSLFTMGVNAMVLNLNGEKTIVQLSDIVKKKEKEQMPEGSTWVENPELHLTAIYLTQTLRTPSKEDITEKVRELQEELTDCFRRGKFIFGMEKEGQGTPLVKLKDEKSYQPVFTDILEFQRFNKENKFRPVVVEGANLPKVLPKQAQGVILNMMSVALPLLIGQAQSSGQVSDAAKEMPEA